MHAGSVRKLTLYTSFYAKASVVCLGSKGCAEAVQPDSLRAQSRARVAINSAERRRPSSTLPKSKSGCARKPAAGRERQLKKNIRRYVGREAAASELIAQLDEQRTKPVKRGVKP